MRFYVQATNITIINCLQIHKNHKVLLTFGFIMIKGGKSDKVVKCQ